MKDKPTMYSGGEPPSNGLEGRIAKAYDYVKDKPHLRVYLDAESMEPEIWKKKDYDDFMKIIRPKNVVNSGLNGKLLIFGTGRTIKNVVPKPWKDWYK